MLNTLEEVIGSIESRDPFGIRDPHAHFSLISVKAPVTSLRKSLPQLRDELTKLFGSEVVVSGGCYGCAMVHFRVQTADAEKASSFVRQILGSGEFSSKTRTANFDILILREQPGENQLSHSHVLPLDNMPPNFGTINLMMENNQAYFSAPVVNSTVATHSAGSSINQHVEDFSKHLCTIENNARRDATIPNAELTMIFGELATMRKELAAKEPNPSIFKRGLEALGKITSIAKDVAELAKTALEAGLF